MKRRALIVLALGLLFSTQAARADWTPVRRINYTNGHSYYPAAAVNSSNGVYIVWEENIVDNAEVYLRRSPDGGATWSAIMNLSANAGASMQPAIAVGSNGSVHVAWEDTAPGDKEIYYRRSTDYGDTWDPAKRISLTGGSSEDPSMAVDSQGTVHIAWYDDTPGNWDIYYARSTDGGDSWSRARRISWTLGRSMNPTVAVDPGSNIHIVWHDNTSGNMEVLYKKSPDGGLSWNAGMRISSNLSGVSQCPHLAIESKNPTHIHVVWYDETPGNPEIYWRESTDGGTTWRGQPVRLTMNEGNSYWPAIALDTSDTVHVVWHDTRPGDAEIYYKRSSAGGGVPWSADRRLSWNSGVSIMPTIAIDSSDSIHVFWHDFAAGNAQIYYKKYVY